MLQVSLRYSDGDFSLAGRGNFCLTNLTLLCFAYVVPPPHPPAHIPHCTVVPTFVSSVVFVECCLDTKSLSLHNRMDEDGIGMPMCSIARLLQYESPFYHVMYAAAYVTTILLKSQMS